MLIVALSPDRVERELVAGNLSCPDCDGELRPWWWARARMLRDGDRRRRIRPRRSRCVSCGRTHVLLPVMALLRRADTVEVIGWAIEQKIAGVGHRRIAVRVGVPATTVRDWLRRFARRAEAIRAHFTALAHRLDASCGRIDPAGSVFCDAVEAIGLAARAAARAYGSMSPWRFASAASAGMLLANTRSPFPAAM